MEERKNRGFYITDNQLNRLLLDNQFNQRQRVINKVKNNHHILIEKDYEYVIKQLRNKVNAYYGNLKRSAETNFRYRALLRLYKRHIIFLMHECEMAFVYTGYERFKKVITRCKRVISTKSENADKYLLEQQTLYSETHLQKTVKTKSEDKNEGKNKSVDRVSKKS